MASREVRDLSPAMQVKWNKFHDLCRRDKELLKHGIQIMLVCTKRSEEERNKLEALNDVKYDPLDGNVFIIIMLQYGALAYGHGELWDKIVQHAKNVGLKWRREGFHGD
jgi:hypothetical protein